MLGLIDADFIKYLVSYDIERMFKQGLKDDTVLPYSTICALVDKRIDKVYETTASMATNYIFLFSGKTRDNYRSLVACEKKYKGTRVYKEKYPKEGEYRDLVEDYIKDNFSYHKEADLEADDLCVMAHEDDTFIYSHDKDLRASPGIHFDIKKNKFTKTTEEVGFQILMTQAMTGDSVDNIIGIHGVGKVGATKIIKGATTERDIITKTIDAFVEKHGIKHGLDAFVEMYSLVNLKTSRGKWTQEKYSDFFKKIEKLKEKDEDLNLF